MSLRLDYSYELKALVLYVTDTSPTPNTSRSSREHKAQESPPEHFEVWPQKRKRISKEWYVFCWVSSFLVTYSF